jgi:hypothetical protein
MGVVGLKNPPNPLGKGESPKLNLNHPLWISDSIYNKNLPSDLILNGSKNVTPPFQRGQGGFVEHSSIKNKLTTPIPLRLCVFARITL